MRIFNLFRTEKKDPEIGKEISWRNSIHVVFKIIDFDNNGTQVDNNGKVEAKSLFKPYGYLTVSNPNYVKKYKLPIIHKDDYLLIEQYFTNQQLKKIVDENEILVVYRPKEITPSGAAGIFHCLHYVIVPKGTVVELFQKYGSSQSEEIIERLFIKFSWEMIKVETNKNPFY